MFNKFVYLLLFTAATLTLLQCQKDENLKPDETIAFKSFIYEAPTFINHFKKDDRPFSGLIVKVKEDALVFERVLIEDALFTKVLTDKQPPLHFQDPDLDLQFYDSDFDFAYFPWQELELIATHSEFLHFSGAAGMLGVSIHDGKEGRVKAQNFSLKVEGDYKLMEEIEKTEGVPVPMSLIGINCPPYWRVE